MGALPGHGWVLEGVARTVQACRDVASELPVSEAQQVQLSDFDMGRTLGCGSFGRVKFAKYKPDGKFYAVKFGSER